MIMLSLQINSTSYIWKDRVSALTIRERAWRRLLRRFLNAMVITTMILFWGYFFVALFLGSDVTHFSALLNLFQTPHTVTLSFWAGSLFGLFLLYQLFSRAAAHHPLPKLDDDALLAAKQASLGKHEREGEDVAKFFREDALRAIEEAYRLAEKFAHPAVTSLHFFVGVLSSRDASLLFGRLGLAFKEIQEPIQRRLSGLPTAPSMPQFQESAEQVILSAFQNSLFHRRQMITASEIMVASFLQDEFLQELLQSKKIERQDFENVIQWIRLNDELVRRYREGRRRASFKPTGAMNRAYTSVATPFLDSVSQDLTAAAVRSALPMLVGREKELKEIFRVFQGAEESVILVGSPGVGKTAMLFGLAERMAEERVPEVLRDKRLIEISLGHVVAGAKGSEAETRLLRALQEIALSQNIVTVIQDIDQMIGEGLDLSALLARELEKRYTILIATARPETYTAKIERSPLGQKLIKVILEEPSVQTAIQILQAEIGRIEHKHRVVFTYQAVAKIVELTDRYMHDRFLPEKAIEVAEETALFVRNDRGEGGKVTEEDAARIVSEKTRVPLTAVGADERNTLLHLEERLHERVIGQDEAVKAIAAALKRARSQLRSEDRPIANFLFLGGTGVGKTELAKTISEVYFGSEEAMVRLDMSEFQENGSVERLIGTTGAGGFLTEAVRQKPFAVLLLDEFEKADPNVLNLFLQVMEDGRLTDGVGRTIDFTNVILIATSNAGATYLAEAVSAQIPMEEIKKNLLERELKPYFRPELLNRFDGVIMFKPLTMEDVIAIAYLMIQKVAERLSVKGIHFQAEDRAVHELAKKGFDPKFGARPLRRVIQEEVDNAIANALLKEEVGRRDTLILEGGGKMRIEKAKAL
jgi:ATP-dependent Clp protease ATP-binding subunit ClpC